MLNKEEDFTGLLNHVKDLKNKYVKAQQYGTAVFLRDIEKIVQNLLEFDEPPDKSGDELTAKLDELRLKLEKKLQDNK